MSIYDRDWYREGYKEKEKKYGGDFSLHSKGGDHRNTKSRDVSAKTDKSEKEFLLKDILTIMAGAITGLFLRYGNKNPALIAGIGIPSNNSFLTILISAGCTFLGIVLFAKASKRRKEGDQGVLNVLAMVISMLIFSFMAVLLFLSIYINYIG